MTIEAIPQAARTRSQRQMAQALVHVSAVQREGERAAKAYGRWCHRVPGLVLTNGLCQTVAFLEDKSKGAGDPGKVQARAGRIIMEHVAQIVGAGRADDLARAVSLAPLSAYMHQTRTLLAAWVYYKRFAVSLLGVQPGDDVEEAE